ncbi:MAG: hypothetical protein JWN32_1667 [Solirubrobacterales bacterium]|jgi:hypothetical protein|nr:hypothetical protein [Solirubrobacterales bacterium]
MTSNRASAYKRVIQTLRDIGPAKLWPAEVACIREAADALLFCGDLAADEDAREGLASVMALGDHLVDAERWTPERVQRLVDDVWWCGPREGLLVPIAA